MKVKQTNYAYYVQWCTVRCSLTLEPYPHPPLEKERYGFDARISVQYIKSNARCRGSEQEATSAALAKRSSAQGLLEQV